MNNFLKNIFSKVVFYYMSKGLDKIFKVDEEVQKRLEIVPNGSKIGLNILGEKCCLTLQKCENGFAFVKNKDNRQCDLQITLKFFETLTKIVFGTSSVTQCYLNDEFFVQGDLRCAVAIVFALEMFIAYLLPKKKFKKLYGFVAENSISKCAMLKTLLFAKRRME